MTASTDSKPTTTKSSSRRALLAGALGGIGAVAAGAVGRVSPVRAEGEIMHVGEEHTTATSMTLLRNNANDETVFRAWSNGAGIGVYGSSNGNIGIVGTSATYIGVYGASSDGVAVVGSSSNNVGVSGNSEAPQQPGIRARSGAAGNSTGLLGSSGPGVPPAKPKTGVYGYAVQDGSSRGVWGRSNTGHGVHGEATTGVALFGKANQNGHALRTRGRIKAEKVSGVATIPAGSTEVTISPPVNVSSGSFVLLTPKTNIGSRALWYTTNASDDTFKIRMSSTRSSNTKVAWLLLG